jgi:hypothetical protein
MKITTIEFIVSLEFQSVFVKKCYFNLYKWTFVLLAQVGPSSRL